MKSPKFCSKKLKIKFLSPKKTVIGINVSGNKIVVSITTNWLMTKTESDVDFVGIVSFFSQ